MSAPQDTFEKVVAHVHEIKLLGSVQALLDWDQQTQLPAAGADYRAEQLTYMAGKIHQLATAPEFGDWLDELAGSELAADPHSDTGCTIRELKYRYDKKKKLPLPLVEAQAKLHSKGQQVWVKARKENDFASFQPVLKEIFQLKREEAQAVSVSDCLYDGLLDDYEPGADTAAVEKALTELKEGLIPLIEKTRDAGLQSDGVLNRHFPVAEQRTFATEATGQIGFDYQRGRLDIAPHPFCTEIGPEDCRITTRYREDYFASAFFGCLHEAGHGMYEQGLQAKHYGLPSGSYCSLGLHESQSRLWENLVGRSEGFWKHFFPSALQHFPESLDGCSLQDFCTEINQIKPSLIRVEADEATYNLHIIIRFELEQALLNDQLAVADLPAAWNEKYQSYLGIHPESDSNGCMQDVHWSAGLVGYFPTYSLGNIYASQLYEKAEADLGNLEQQFAEGNFANLLQWMRTHVHEPGNRYRAHELMERITGRALDQGPIIRHLTRKADRLCVST